MKLAFWIIAGAIGAVLWRGLIWFFFGSSIKHGWHTLTKRSRASYLMIHELNVQGYKFYHALFTPDQRQVTFLNGRGGSVTYKLRRTQLRRRLVVYERHELVIGPFVSRWTKRIPPEELNTLLNT